MTAPHIRIQRATPARRHPVWISSVLRLTLPVVAAAAFSLTAPAVHAEGMHRGGSEASLLVSALPVAFSVIAPSAVLVAGAKFVVVGVEKTSRGTVWVLERVSDGVRVSVEFVGSAVSGAAASAGTAIAVTAISTGFVLSAASEAVAFIPNEIGNSLLHNERITDKDRVTR